MLNSNSMHYCRLAIAISSALTASAWTTAATAADKVTLSPVSATSPQNPADSKQHHSVMSKEKSVKTTAQGTLVVTEDTSVYAVEHTLSATRTDTPVTEVPQSVQVINRRVIDEQAAHTLSDALVNVSGVRPVRNDETLFAQPIVRGFPAEIYLDGLPAFGGTAASIDPASLIGAERIEVLKGPTSALYGGGIGAPLGGLINEVSKRPEAEAGGMVGVRTGSYSTFNPYGDINVPLGDKVAVRLSGSYEESKSWIDQVKSRNGFLQPSVSFELSP